MDKRKKVILQAITDDYIQTAEPVGSRTIARKYRLGVSPATIRNEMADLEESGYLQQPHTSAGRIPSDKGYRFYVDVLMPQAELAPAQREHLRGQVRSQAVEELLHRATRLLAELTHYAAVATAPSITESVVKTVQFIPIDERNILAIVVSEPGFVQHRIVEVGGIAPHQLAPISGMVTALLRGVSTGSITPTIKTALAVCIPYTNLYIALLDMLDMNQTHKNGEQVYLEGSVNLMDQPEFREVGKARAILSALEEPGRLVAVLNQADGVSVAIGNENNTAEMRDCSVVTATYQVNGIVFGSIGVVGPTRMEYTKAIALVECVAETISDFLNKMHRA